MQIQSTDRDFPKHGFSFSKHVRASRHVFRPCIPVKDLGGGAGDRAAVPIGLWYIFLLKSIVLLANSHLKRSVVHESLFESELASLPRPRGIDGFHRTFNSRESEEGRREEGGALHWSLSPLLTVVYVTIC